MTDKRSFWLWLSFFTQWCIVLYYFKSLNLLVRYFGSNIVALFCFLFFICGMLGFSFLALVCILALTALDYSQTGASRWYFSVENNMGRSFSWLVVDNESDGLWLSLVGGLNMYGWYLIFFLLSLATVCHLQSLLSWFFWIYMVFLLLLAALDSLGSLFSSLA